MRRRRRGCCPPSFRSRRRRSCSPATACAGTCRACAGPVAPGAHRRAAARAITARPVNVVSYNADVAMYATPICGAQDGRHALACLPEASYLRLRGPSRPRVGARRAGCGPGTLGEDSSPQRVARAGTARGRVHARSAHVEAQRASAVRAAIMGPMRRAGSVPGRCQSCRAERPADPSESRGRAPRGRGPTFDRPSACTCYWIRSRPS